ncbi:MAG: hypothetical protein U0R70_03625 [Solirubrobacteraceae bacterium]
MSTVAVAGAPSAPPSGALSTTEKRSSPSAAVSFAIGTVTALAVSPGANVTVALDAAKSRPALAVPPTVATRTCDVTPAAPDRTTVSVALPPSAAVTLAAENARVPAACTARQAENSDVPSGPVAVAVSCWPGAEASGREASNAAFPGHRR